MSTLPHHLLEQIRSGNVVLFLGAGASFGIKDSKGETCPTGQGLSDLIADKFLGKEYVGKSLSYVSELAISEAGLFEVQSFIANIFKGFGPEEQHLKVPSFAWKAIFTTNYDLVIEKAYQKYGNKLQEAVAVCKNMRAQDIFTHEKIVPYYKLHGCVTDINDPDAPLILTPDQYINHKSKRERVFYTLQELSYDYPILFIGFSMADSDIRAILNGLDQNMSVRVRSYMVGPHITQLEEKMWDNKKISSLKMTFAEFMNEIDKEVDRNSRILASVRPEVKLPIYEKFSVNFDDFRPSESFNSFLDEDIDFIHPNMPSPNTNAKEFYKGHFNNWDPIIKNLDINRKIKDGILFEAFIENHESDKQFFYLLKGNAGSGKSVLLKRLAFDAGVTLERTCVFLKEIEKIRVEQIIELYTYVKDRIYLFIDNISLLESDIAYLMKRCKKEKVRLTIIGAERINVWNMECQTLSNYLTESYQIKYLHDGEIRELLLLLEKHNSLGTLENKSETERIDAFSERAGRELLVSLYEATNGKPFSEIIFDEYKSINDTQAQSLYLTVSIFHRLGVSTRAGFISRVHNIGLHQFKQELFKPLDSIIFDKKDNKVGDFVYLTRNRVIAEIIFERVLATPQDRYDEYIRILKCINIDYENDRVAFVAITNAKKLISDFPDPKMIREIFSVAEDNVGTNPKLLQQKAIFEMTSTGGSMDSASRYLQEAYKIAPDDLIISHSFAEMMYKRAERTTLNSAFFSNIDKCLEICSSIINSNGNYADSHPHHTSLKALVLKLKHILDYEETPIIDRAIKEIEKAFLAAKQVFPNEEFILEIESKFNEVINQKENAKELLEKAFKINKGSPFLASRLASFYEKEGDFSRALQIVKDALEINSGDKDLNLKYALLLEKTANPNFEDIKYYLKRSFTPRDSRYFAQLWYARSLYITNQFKEAADIFEILSQVNIAPDLKRNPIGKLSRNDTPAYFEGAITKIETSYGFVKRDALGDSLYFYRFEDDYVWEKFKKGARVSFRVGFNCNC